MAAKPSPAADGAEGFDLLSLDQMLADADRAEAAERSRQNPRREADLQDARRVVREELTMKTLGRDLTPAMEAALQRAWLPLMSVILSRRGMNSRPWMMGIELLEKLLDLADPPDDRPAAPLTITRGVDRLARALRQVGVPTAAVGTIYSRLLAAFSQTFPQEGDNAESPRDTARSTVLLRQVLAQDGWFEFDGGDGQQDWLKPRSFSGEGGFVCFARADGSGERSINIGSFLDQLARGSVRPIEPSPRARLLIEELITRRLTSAGG